jgi:hypothetical protein
MQSIAEKKILPLKALSLLHAGRFSSAAFFQIARTFKKGRRLKWAYFNQSVNLFNICGTSSSIFKIILTHLFDQLLVNSLICC